MSNDSRSTRKFKEDESSNSKKKGLNGKGSGSPASVSGGTDTSGLRRSARETSSRKQLNESPSSTRKSERLEKRMATTPEVKKKAEEAEIQTIKSPLRRSDRGKKHISGCSSGTKKSGKGSASSEGKREEKEQSLEHIKNEMQDLELGVRKRNAMSAHSYKASFKSQRRKIAEDIYEEAKPSRSRQTDSSSDGNSGSKSVETDRGDDQNCVRQGKVLAEEFVERESEGRNGAVGSDLKSLDAVVKVEACYSRRKLRFTEGHNASFNKDGSRGSENSGIVEGALDDTAGKSPDGGSSNGGSENSGSGDRTISCNRNLYKAKMHTDSCKVAINKDTQTSRVDASSPPLSNNHDSDETCATCFEKPRFVEYWVPVQISNMQLEQYCATLLSNTMALCSRSKNDPVGALRDVLVFSRKCCDHPYIVDPLLQISVTKNLSPAEYLDIGIKASGKLQLLDSILSELKKRQLRVLILYQPVSGTGKEPISIGDILDDFVRQRFGQDSYEHTDAIVSTKRRQASLNNFNKDKGKFVFLLEHRACLPSIKLSSVDIIIIFDSDWNPMNDIRAIQKITIDAQPRQIKIFRLYSCCTVEERLLLKADHHHLSLDNKLQNFNRSTIDTLLMWGASYLFSKLDEFHNSSISTISCEQSELNTIVAEILDLISQNCKSKDTANSVITRVEQCGGTYSKNHTFLGKLKVQLQEREQPNTFWRKLLDGRNPQWKYLSMSTLRNRKRIHYSEESPRKTDLGTEEVAKKRKKMVVNCTDPAPSNPDVEEGISEVPANFTPQSLPTERLRSTEVQQETAVAEKSLYGLLKLDVSRLCHILKLSEEINAMIGRFLKYIIDNHRVSREPTSILQAFLISLCWIGASLLKHKIDKKESLDLAKQHMKFSCTEKEAISVYFKLKRLKEMFLSSTENIVEPDSSNDSQRASVFSATETIDLSISNADSLNMQGEKLKIGRPHSQHVGERLIHAKPGESKKSGIAKKNTLESTKQVQIETENQMLAEKHQKELEELNIKWENKRRELQKVRKADNSALARGLNCSLSVRLDKFKALDAEFTRKMEEYKRQRDVELEDIKARHLAEAKFSTDEGGKSAPSCDGADSIVSTSPHLENQTQLPAECETAPTDLLECLDSVGMETPHIESDKEKSVAESSGHDMPNEGGMQNDGIPTSNSRNSPACDHQLPADLDVQNDCPQPSSCSRMQDKDVQGNRSSSPQVDLPLQPVVTGQCNQSNADHSQSQPNFPIASGGVNVPSFADVSDNELRCDEEYSEAHPHTNTVLHIRENQPERYRGGTLDHQPLGGLPNSSQTAETLTQAVEATAHHPNLFGLHTGTNLSIGQGSYNPYQVISQMPSAPVNSADPLQIELERLRKEMEHVNKFCEDMKLRLKSERDKEITEAIAQIRGKYESKCQDAEAEFLQKRKELDANHNKVLMNKVLADAFRSKCIDLRPPGAMGLQHVMPSSMPSSFMHQLRQLSLQTAPRPPPVVTPSSAVQQPSFSQHTTTPPLHSVNNSSALFSGSSGRPPNINSVTPSAGNRQVNSEFRAPAPHIQPFRPSTSPSPSNLPSFTRMMSSQHAQGSLPTAPPGPTEASSQQRSRSSSPSPGTSASLSGLPILQRSGSLSGISPSLPQPSSRPLSPLTNQDSPTFPQPSSCTPPFSTNHNLPFKLPASSSLSHLQPISGLYNKPPELPNAGLPSSSMVELLMATINQAGETPPQPNSSPPLPDFGLNFESLDLSQFGTPLLNEPVSSARSTLSTDVVCLSDDDD